MTSRIVRHPSTWLLSAERAALPSLRYGLRFSGQCVLLYLLYTVGSLVTRVLHLPLPGNLVGMLLLLLLLRLGVLQPAHVREASTLIVRHFNFFFVPLVVGLMAWTGLFATRGVILGTSLVGSVIVGLATAGFVAQRGTAGGGPTDGS